MMLQRWSLTLILGTSLLAVTTKVSAEVIDRGLLAEQKCQAHAIPSPSYHSAGSGMAVHYRPSQLQRVLTPIYTTIIDDFGGIMQSLISGSDEYQVAYTLTRLGHIVRDAPLNTAGKVCMATCMVNHLMEPDDAVIPTTSMTLAVAQGKGFCRHFSLATIQVLRAAGIAAKTEVAIDHMFLKLNLNGKRYYTDPSNQDGLTDCNFIPVQ